MRPEYKMKVIGHQAMGDDAHLQALVRILHQLHKCRVIILFVKHFLPGIATVDHVITHPAD